jgi:glycosyltransferase involved in cell wall biosynthesis
MNPDPQSVSLTVLIPTRTRAAFLDSALKAFSSQVQTHHLESIVEIVCVDNFSSDDTSAVVTRHAHGASFIRYFKQLAPRASAETSLFHAIGFTRTDYVRCFGDDDLPEPDALPKLLSFLNSSKPSFVLLNPRILLPGGQDVIDYFTPAQEPVSFSSGIELFEMFGLVSATTTISCLVFLRKEFREETALRLASRSEIYSHSAALFLSFRDRPAAFFRSPILTYRQNSYAEEATRFDTFSRSEKGAHAIFTSGLIRLLKEISRDSGVPIRRLLAFREPELRKDNWTTHEGPLWRFVLRSAHEHLRDVSKSPDRLSDWRYHAGIVCSVAGMLFVSRHFLHLANYLRKAVVAFWRPLCHAELSHED